MLVGASEEDILRDDGCIASRQGKVAYAAKWRIDGSDEMATSGKLRSDAGSEDEGLRQWLDVSLVERYGC